MAIKVLLRKRAIIETVNDQLKNISQIEHTRNRSVNNFLVNTLCGIAAYVRQPKKPRIKISRASYYLKKPKLRLISLMHMNCNRILGIDFLLEQKAYVYASHAISTFLLQNENKRELVNAE